jgi:hypothetical protein
LNHPTSFQDFLRSHPGRVQLAWWMGGVGAVFTLCFAVFAWFADAEVPVLFWPVIAGGGALLGLHFCHLRWQAAAEKRGER